MRRLALRFMLLPALASSAPDRAGLIQAWEAAMRRDGTLDAQPVNTTIGTSRWATTVA